MREVTRGTVTPQMKGIGVNNRFGNSNIRLQQGTSKSIFDTLQVTQAELQQGVTLRFYEDVQNRAFPLTNLDNTNQLTVGETLITENYYLAKAEIAEGGGFEKFEQLSTDELGQAEFSFEIGNSLTIKRLPLLSSLGRFNPNAGFEGYAVYNFYTQVVIPPLMNFVGIVRIPPFAGAPANGLAFRLNIEGVGSLLAPRTTF